jgi:glycosyltransferase involved in cell wall biosynthesis
VNILFVDQFSDPGGAQLCLRDLLPEVLGRGWQSRLMAPGPGEFVTHPLALGPYTNGSKSMRDYLRFSIDMPRAALAIRRVVQEGSIDLLYVNGPRVLPAAIGISCPVVFHAHNHVSGFVPRTLVSQSVRLTGALVIAASQFIARAYTEARVIYNGVADLSGGPRSFQNRPVRIGIIGRIAPQKGQLDFVRAAGIIENARFFVFGEELFGNSRYTRAVKDLAANAPVEFRGWTNDVGGALRDLDILAVPSGRAEAATRVIPEAFSAGTPVVAYRAGGIPELIEHGRTGVLTERPDFESLARSLQALAGDQAMLERLSAAGRTEWERRFRVETFRTNICDLLETHVQSSASRHQR